RAFPAYVSDEVMSEVATSLRGRWINLWRHTDPIGGAVAAPGVTDLRFPEPTQFARQPGDPTYPEIRAHSGYPDDPRVAGPGEELSELLRTAPAEVASD